MIIKQTADDFQVEELTDVTSRAHDGGGVFALYRMEKSGWTTPDALAAVRRRWKIDLCRLSYGGLKDRHARTVQYFTIHHGPRRNLAHHTVSVTYLGQVATAYTSSDIRANRFRITLRKLPPARRPDIEQRLTLLPTQGVPNYFDDQRFGSVAGPGSDFIARHLIEGKFEAALQLALTAPYAYDQAAEKKEKATLLRLWGDWEKCKAELPRGHARSLVDYLRVHPGDYRGAAARLRPDLRGLYMSAFQSHLWNRLLARWLERNVPASALRPVKLRTGPLPFHAEVPPEVLPRLTALSLPLPTARWKPNADDPHLGLVEEVLSEEGLTLAQLQVRGVRDLFFSRGERPGLCIPVGLTHDWDNDERHAGWLRATVAFELGRGSYATLMVKALTAGIKEQD